MLYAVSFHAGTVEVYDGNFNAVTLSGSFQDPSIPVGYVPFNIWATGNKLYVTFAMQDSSKSNPVAGAGNGYVDLFDANGSLVQSIAAGGTLNAPQGLAIAPSKFGDFAGALLVGNFGDGTINAFDVTNSRALGVLANVSGQPLSIPGLRSLSTGNGGSAGDANALYFTAAPGNQSHGLFGSLQAAPVVNGNGVINAAGFQLGAAPYTFVSIIGNNLAATTRQWQSSDFVNGQLPRSLDGVNASINGIPAYISYVSPTQLNVLMPAGTSPGSLVMTNNGLSAYAGPYTVLSTLRAGILSSAGARRLRGRNPHYDKRDAHRPARDVHKYRQACAGGRDHHDLWQRFWYYAARRKPADHSYPPSDAANNNVRIDSCAGSLRGSCRTRPLPIQCRGPTGG